MRKARNKGFFSRKFAATFILPAVVVCTMIFVVGVVSAKSGDSRSASNEIAVSGRGELSDEWETVVMRVTAYCACRRCCGEYSDGKTASGHTIRQGDVFVAADKKYRFGTGMKIPGYNGGRAVQVLDRGGVIRGERLDVFFNSHKEALKWGVKYLEVKVRSK